MNLGITLKAAEKVFGPALPGPGEPESTLSAIRYAAGGTKKFAGVLGLHENAKFHIHFPTPVDWVLLETKKGIPDFINDLKESGPQGAQGREVLVAKFLPSYGGIKAKILSKQAAGKIKAELPLLRKRLAPFVGERQATLTIGSETLSLPIKITMDKKGKIKFAANL